MNVRVSSVLIVGALLLSACAAATAASDCAPVDPDCEDVVVLDPGRDEPIDRPAELDVSAARDAAAAVIGRDEDGLDAHVRIGRRGDEHYMLTEDYVLGRITVTLEADDSGTFRVVAATVELPDGPETLTE